MYTELSGFISVVGRLNKYTQTKKNVKIHKITWFDINQ